MANYYLSMKNGKAISAVANFSYNMGLDKYSYKENEIVDSFHNIPNWATSPKNFWEIYSVEDRANSSYKKIELSLQNELSLEENKELLKNFIKENIGSNYYYSAVIHDKESSIDNIKNTHAHIMICKRLEDNLRRSPEQFFSRYNNKNPEKGGALTDNNYWGKKSTLIKIRNNWEQNINDFFLKKNINKKVSCKSLEYQKNIALEKGDLLEAEKLNRPSVSVDGYIFKKDFNNLTEKEKEKLEFYQECIQIKNLKELVFSLEKEKLELEELEKNQNLERDKFKNSINQVFSEIFELKHSIFMLNLEKETLNEKLNNDLILRREALRSLNKNYAELELQISVAKKNDENIFSLEEKLDVIAQNTPSDKITQKIHNIISSTKNTIDSISVTENQLYSKLYDSLDFLNLNNDSNKIEILYNENQYKDWENNFTMFKEKKKECNNYFSKLKEIEKNLSEEQLNFYAYNSLSKGEYSKLMKDLNGVKNKLLNSSLSEKELNRLAQREKILETRVNKIKNEYKKGNSKNIFIRRKASIKSKYLEQYSDIKKTYDKLNIELTLLKNNINSIPEEKQNEFRKKFNKNNINSNIYSLKTENQKLIFEKKQLDYKLKESSLQTEVLNILTNGEYKKLIESYRNLLLEKAEIEKTFSNSEKLDNINANLKNLEIKQNNLISSVDKKTYSILKDRLYGNIFNTISSIKEKIEKNSQKIENLESIANENVKFGGGFSKLRNFNPDYVKATLGDILYTGNMNLSNNDKFDIQIKREMDFSL